jgi:hypothetical protein
MVPEARRGHGVSGQSDRHDRQTREDQHEFSGAPAAQFALGAGRLGAGGLTQWASHMSAAAVLRAR